jgi:hypothetical protein
MSENVPIYYTQILKMYNELIDSLAKNDVDKAEVEFFNLLSLLNTKKYDKIKEEYELITYTFEDNPKAYDNNEIEKEYIYCGPEWIWGSKIPEIAIVVWFVNEPMYAIFVGNTNWFKDGPEKAKKIANELVKLEKIEYMKEMTNSIITPQITEIMKAILKEFGGIVPKE